MRWVWALVLPPLLVGSLVLMLLVLLRAVEAVGLVALFELLLAGALLVSVAFLVNYLASAIGALEAEERRRNQR